MKTFKQLTGIFFLSVLLAIFISLSGAIPINPIFSNILGPVLYFIFTLLTLKKTESILKPYLVVIAVFLGSCVLEVPLRIIFFNASLISLPWFVFKSLAIVLAPVFNATKSTVVRSFLVVISLIILLLFGLNFDRIFLNKLNYDTYTGHYHEKINPFKLEKNDGSDISFGLEGETYQFLYFWRPDCDVCIERFPEIESVYRQFGYNKDRIQIWGVYCRFPHKGETFDTGSHLLKDHGFTFPCLSTVMDKVFLGEELKIKVFPTVLIIDPEGYLIYRGSMKGAIKTAEKQLKRDNPNRP